MSTVDWLRAKGATLVDHINDERDRLIKWGESWDADEDLKDLSVMAMALSNAARDAAYAAAAAAADMTKNGRGWVHAEEIAAEVAAGEYEDDR